MVGSVKNIDSKYSVGPKVTSIMISTIVFGGAPKIIDQEARGLLKMTRDTIMDISSTFCEADNMETTCYCMPTESHKDATRPFALRT